ncbi:spermidine synthase [Paenibacillus humicola]|uniref:spermidine synthase n=1 Tax=Paenibacillus humicola TaxID=3110540 RepID=UPI00237C20C0|nr:fused MFS/spermidine synthase [Paenibacillus humicola]
MRVLFRQPGETGEITVCETAELYSEKGRFRVLQFADGAVQGAIDLDRPERIVLEYPQAILHLMACGDPAYEDVFLIGHGIGTIAGHAAGKRVKSAELDGTIAELSRTYFGFRGDRVHIGDGRRLLERERANAYDYIVVDAFTEKGTPAHLTSEEFFALAGGKLDADGAVILNLAGKGADDPRIHAVYMSLGAVFAYTKAFALPKDGAAGLQNILLMGSRRPIVYRARRMAGFAEIRIGAGLY